MTINTRQVTAALLLLCLVSESLAMSAGKAYAEKLRQENKAKRTGVRGRAPLPSAPVPTPIARDLMSAYEEFLERPNRITLASLRDEVEKGEVDEDLKEQATAVAAAAAKAASDPDASSATVAELVDDVLIGTLIAREGLGSAVVLGVGEALETSKAGPILPCIVSEVVASAGTTNFGHLAAYSSDGQSPEIDYSICQQWDRDDSAFPANMPSKTTVRSGKEVKYTTAPIDVSLVGGYRDNLPIGPRSAESRSENPPTVDVSLSWSGCGKFSLRRDSEIFTEELTDRTSVTGYDRFMTDNGFISAHGWSCKKHDKCNQCIKMYQTIHGSKEGDTHVDKRDPIWLCSMSERGPLSDIEFNIVKALYLARQDGVSSNGLRRTCVDLWGSRHLDYRENVRRIGGRMERDFAMDEALRMKKAEDKRMADLMGAAGLRE